MDVAERLSRGLASGCTAGRLYWNDEVRTKEAIDSAGWMHTGDLATIDDEGYCRIVGRIKDMVIRGGENIYPREVEEYLYGHPDIQDVQIFGMPDTKYGEELCAWIVAKAGTTLDEEGVRRFCRDRISHYKVPRHIRFVESFPSTVTGKVQKFAMREAMIKEFARAREPNNNVRSRREARSWTLPLRSSPNGDSKERAFARSQIGLVCNIPSSHTTTEARTFSGVRR